MTQSNIRPLTARTRANWIRLRTMILLRWVAITGQLIAITVAQLVYGLQLELGFCYLAIGASVIGNLVATLVFPENKRLSERENLLMVMFDLLQLGFLLFLTGGLNNPFSLLVLGPVTISATALSLRSTVVLCATAIILVSGLAVWHLPLTSQSGDILRLPGLFIFGQWTALIIAIVFTSAYSRRVTTEVHSMGDALSATQMALAREQKLTDLGGVIAAAAHELGTPLATIKLTSVELLNDLADHPDLADDAALIRDQADRCRDILRDMGRAGKDDLHIHKAPLETVVLEAAEPHMNRGKQVLMDQAFTAAQRKSQPLILRKPEIVHGLRNLVQNAVDFASERVWVSADWTEETVTVRIIDDGPGFPPYLLGRIGDPFMRRRSPEKNRSARPEYEGMGLGLFIAKTLLERSGATLRFANGSEDRKAGDRTGAVVEVNWPRRMLNTRDHEQPLGQNPQITT
ncbi:ActS/PrrB/RegB family redox-sensitive histidine kinase [Sulfitobacter mediterraneus]|uniref:sensor histidine kinase RegB n=1 Tax=Sulfitobacter mediterraneus TaxID=83219 RepID=UPI001932F9C5|nr:ActS/PrrB/RegB family redox-sensitive histidine kinase [Sulfitobacter mediterraneus]MBM1308643.1 ActS/PrrB/RegB family redox-sensitive histidine kinase [Sulfitobacter mediterraneus]MBM1312528.1 ActS/PrrB/RegB family redox-sensitive histidine kinase [Sulfitobacter mediterraneus]MBM1320909.1 ActS/PrrB/RegB family redox-sensitive histidine kinase [Sulfitobacter mediterraneus]MBM1324797.1 ActS/PrrB/RegB family redox-sensitive histidine kinase [Sulfitobacter mediterraneus]MBM1396143.1 ActS/PrrB/